MKNLVDITKVLKVTKSKKRIFIICAFLFVTIACTKADEDLATSEVENEPLLSLSELLAASDVKQSLALAAKNNDKELIRYWQSLLIEAAKEVRLGSSQLNLLQGESGETFLMFQGMKTNYQQDFEQAFFSFGDIDSVFEQYPDFKVLHDASRELVRKRDELINAIEKDLVKEGFSGDTQVKARQLWQDSMKIENPQ